MFLYPRLEAHDHRGGVFRLLRDACAGPTEREFVHVSVRVQLDAPAVVEFFGFVGLPDVVQQQIIPSRPTTNIIFSNIRELVLQRFSFVVSSVTVVDVYGFEPKLFQE